MDKLALNIKILQINNKLLVLDLRLNQRPKYLKVRQLTLILSPCLSRANGGKKLFLNNQIKLIELN